jgi:hypothetical protein
MKYRKLDANDDYQFGNGNADFHKDTPETVAQAVVTRLRLWAAEWFLDTTDGTPYQAGVLGKNNKAKADASVRERILGTTGVSGILEFDSFFNPDLRTYSFSATIDTTFGAAQINEIL